MTRPVDIIIWIDVPDDEDLLEVRDWVDNALRSFPYKVHDFDVIESDLSGGAGA